MENKIQMISIDKLLPHPQNPRIIMRDDVIDGIMAGLNDGFHHSHAIQVWPVEDEFYILSGHHRVCAAKKKGIDFLPCWIRDDMDENGAYMLLVTDNNQGELSPLEIGMHALRCVSNSTGGKGKRGGLSEYARLVGKNEKLIRIYRQAAEVVVNIGLKSEVSVLIDKAQHLSVIHSLPESLWQAAVDLMLEHEWSAKETTAAVDRAKSVISVKPEWWKKDITAILKKTAIEPGYSKSMSSMFKTMSKYHDKLPGKEVLYIPERTNEIKEINGREHYKVSAKQIDYAARDMFIKSVNKADGEMTSKIAETAYKTIINYINEYSTKQETWMPVLTDEEELQRRKRIEEIAKMEDREKFMPVLVQGDLIEKIKFMQPDIFDLICVDPPYNMDKAEWDSFGSGKDFAIWCKAWINESRRLLKDTGSIYIFGLQHMLAHLYMECEGSGLVFQSWISWDTIQGQGSGLWPNRVEGILYFSKTKTPYEDPDSVKMERHEEHIREYKGKEYKFKSPSTIWRFPCVDNQHPDRTAHPTQKPVELIERIIKASCPPDGNVLDFFIGSGTTGVACMKNRRYCTGVDNNSDYLSIARSRFDNTKVASE